MEDEAARNAFATWWVTKSPPGTVDKEQCRVSFLAGWEARLVDLKTLLNQWTDMMAILEKWQDEG